MSDFVRMCPCQMKLDLENRFDKLAFIKENWAEILQLKYFDTLPPEDIKCALCLFNIIFEALAHEEYDCMNRDIINLVRTSMYAENCLMLHECQEEIKKLEAARKT